MSLVGTRPPTVDEYEQYELGHRKCNEFLLPIKESGVKIYLLCNGR